ncbi:hypothetical protein BD410DRAFT_508776 [Rickenella mellea]|uniref:Uncharacterized protein n=1 Tax=Rickenella mellea TaxID=50990 RepID=A0A4Y7PU61_9AGAM|nr:hypothetical protein BD410DRAFT_508776 [Rickenella mellea]
MDAVDRHLKRCRASATREMNAFFLTNHKFYNFDAEGLTRHLDWINRTIIHEAKISVQYLQNPNTSSEGWSTDRAVCAMSVMLRSLRTKKMREEFWNCGRLTIINTLISQLMQCRHDTRGHSSFLLETLHRIIGSSLSPNDADLDTQAKFIRLVEDAISHSPHVHPLAFPVVEVLLSVFDELDHPASITLAIDAIDCNQWLLDNNFPLETTVQKLHTKLLQLTERNSSNDPALSLGSPSSVSPWPVNNQQQN